MAAPTSTDSALAQDISDLPPVDQIALDQVVEAAHQGLATTPDEDSDRFLEMLRQLFDALRHERRIGA